MIGSRHSRDRLETFQVEAGRLRRLIDEAGSTLAATTREAAAAESQWADLAEALVALQRKNQRLRVRLRAAILPEPFLGAVARLRRMLRLLRALGIYLRGVVREAATREPEPARTPVPEVERAPITSIVLHPKTPRANARSLRLPHRFGPAQRSGGRPQTRFQRR